MNSDGLVVDRNELAGYYLPPSQRVSFLTKVSSDLKEGPYTLVLTFDLGDGESVVKEVDFTKDRSQQLTVTQTRD